MRPHETRIQHYYSRYMINKVLDTEVHKARPSSQPTFSKFVLLAFLF